MMTSASAVPRPRIDRAGAMTRDHAPCPAGLRRNQAMMERLTRTYTERIPITAMTDVHEKTTA